MTRQQEIEVKLTRVRSFLGKNGYDAVLFTSEQSFAWLACGAADLVEHSNEMGRSFANVLVTENRAYLLASNIELPRLLAEEVVGLDILEPVEYPWTEGGSEAAVDRILGAARGEGERRAADTWIEGMVNEKGRLGLLRTPLCSAEVERFRILCRRSAEAMSAAIEKVRPGMSEIEIQSIAGREVLRRDAFPTIILVGTDDRISRFRHPVPTEARLERYCMVVICAQKWGLVSSLTRLVHFGAFPGELRSKYDSLLSVEGSLIGATTPGRSLADIFEVGVKAYSDAGYPGEEKKHFQGGTCGYYSREQELSPVVDYRIQEGEIFAHNPSITGVKVEDTMYVHGGDIEVLTEMQGWPTIEHTQDGITLKRPDVLLR